MVQINFAKKQVNAKIVYYGPGMSGKTTNLEVIHQRAPEGNRGDLTSISTEGDRTLFFDFMPLDLGTVAGLRTCFQIYTVFGQVYYNSTRKLVLQGVDGVIFVADSSPNMMEENLESLRNLAENLAEYGRSIDEMPLVIQYNKRDIPGAFSIDELEEQLNPAGAPAFEAIANTGQGVFPTLKAVAACVLDSLHKQQGDAAAATSMPGTETTTAAPAASPSAMPAPRATAAPELSATPPAPLPSPAQAEVAAPTPAAPVPSASNSPASLPPAPGSQPAKSATPAPVASAAGDSPLPESPRPKISMSQTGFHKAPSTPIQGAKAAEPAAAGLPSPPASSAPAPTPAAMPAPAAAPAPPVQAAPAGLSMAKAPAPKSQQQGTGIRMDSPKVAQRPQMKPAGQAGMQTQATAKPATQQAPARTQPARTGAATPSKVMGVESGTKAPQKRAPQPRSFPSPQTKAEARPTPKGKKSAVVTGVIVITSVVVGAALGSFVLSIL